MNTEKLMEQLKEKMKEEDIEKEIKRVIEEYAEMINRDAAIHILAFEQGIISSGKKQLKVFKDLEERSGYSFEGTVKRVFLAREGKGNSSQRILLTDDEGNELILAVWNEHIDKIKGIKPGDKLKVENAYYRSGEMHLGLYGKIQVKTNLQYTPIMNLKDGRGYNVLVRVIEEIKTRKFMRNGEERLMAKGVVADHTGKVPIVIWGKSTVEQFTNRGEGSKYYLENVMFRNGEISVNEYSKILPEPKAEVLLRIDELIRGAKGPVKGVIEEIKNSEGQVEGIVQSGGKQVKAIFKPDSTKDLFNRELPEDVKPSTITYLKLKSLLKALVILEGYIENGRFYVEKVKL